MDPSTSETEDGVESSNEDVKDIWSNFSEWLHCICVVTFDLELGQAMECVYPNHVQLTDTERTNICYLAFPDSNSGCMGDTQYCFKIRKEAKLSPRRSEADYLCSVDCPVTLTKDNLHYYGYVYFRQVRDKTLRRGYFQKSVVLLSSWPYFNFFKEIVDIIAPEYFDNGEPCLEAACNNIDQWPSPIPGKMLNLPLMGMLLHIRIPTKQDKPETSLLNNSENAKSLDAYTLSSLNEVDMYEHLKEVISHIQLLWELVLLGEPLIIMAPSPTACSSTVLALISSISPLRYHCDYRPYFTIHDSEFKEYTAKHNHLPNVMLGVTNPFFTKTFQHWPHIVRVGETGLGSYGGSSPSLLSDDTKLKKTSKLKTLDQKSGVYTKYKPFLKKDKAFLKIFTKGLMGKKPAGVATALIKRHFLELTQSFIIPLERYVASLMPLQKSISPHRSPPPLKPFRPHDFMLTIENNGPQLTSGTKGDWFGLYDRFFFSANFKHWLKRRRTEMEAKVLSLHFIALSESDLSSNCQNNSEVELVDLILRLKKKVRMVTEHRLDVPTLAIDRLNAKIGAIIETLPVDLRGFLINK